MSTHLLADTAEHPDFRWKLPQAQCPAASTVPASEGAHLGVGLWRRTNTLAICSSGLTESLASKYKQHLK